MIRPLLLAAALAAMPCSLAAQPAPAPLPSVSLPPALDRVLRDYERHWRARDMDAIAGLFAEDGFVLAGGRPPARGRAAIREAYAGQGGALSLRALAFAAADTVGYILGAYRYGDATEDQGKFTLTLRRAPGGRWEIFSDMDNPSAPPRRRPPADAVAPPR